MGGIVGALIGRHLDHMEEQRRLSFEPIAMTMKAFQDDPVGGPVTPEDYIEAVKQGMAIKRIGKDFLPQVEAYAKWAQRQRDIQAMNDQARKAMGNAPHLAGQAETSPWRQQPGQQPAQPGPAQPPQQAAAPPSDQLNFSQMSPEQMNTRHRARRAAGAGTAAAARSQARAAAIPATARDAASPSAGSRQQR